MPHAHTDHDGDGDAHIQHLRLAGSNIEPVAGTNIYVHGLRLTDTHGHLDRDRHRVTHADVNIDRHPFTDSDVNIDRHTVTDSDVDRYSHADANRHRNI